MQQTWLHDALVRVEGDDKAATERERDVLDFEACMHTHTHARARERDVLDFEASMHTHTHTHTHSDGQ